MSFSLPLWFQKHFPFCREQLALQRKQKENAPNHNNNNRFSPTCLITFICSHCHGKTKQTFSINTEWIKDPHIKCVIVLFLKMIGCSLILKSTQKHSTYIPCQTILWVINTLKKIVHKYKTHPQIYYVKLARKQMALTQHWTGITCCIFFTNLQYNIPQFHLLFSDLILGSLCSDNFNSWKILFTIHE